MDRHRDEPSMTKIFDTHAHDYNLWHGQTCSQSAGELPRKKRTGQASDRINENLFGYNPQVFSNTLQHPLFVSHDRSGTTHT